MNESLITQSVWPSTRQLLSDRANGAVDWPSPASGGLGAWGYTMRQGRAWAEAFDALAGQEAPGSAADAHRTILGRSR